MEASVDLSTDQPTTHPISHPHPHQKNTTTHQILSIKFIQVSLQKHYTIDTRFYGVHTVLGSILAFITVFRCVSVFFCSFIFYFFGVNMVGNE